MTTLVLALVTTKRPQNPRTITTTVFNSPSSPSGLSKKIGLLSAAVITYLTREGLTK